MSAVKNSISEYKNNAETGLFSSKENWNLQPINNAFLQSVCIVLCVVYVCIILKKKKYL